MRQPQAARASGDMAAAKAAPVADPSRMPPLEEIEASAPIAPRRPGGACSTRNTIEVVPSPPTDRPWIMRNAVSRMGAASPSVSCPGSAPTRKVGTAIAATERASALRRP